MQSALKPADLAPRSVRHPLEPPVIAVCLTLRGARPFRAQSTKFYPRLPGISKEVSGFVHFQNPAQFGTKWETPYTGTRLRDCV